jgi:hypothetical protein
MDGYRQNRSNYKWPNQDQKIKTITHRELLAAQQQNAKKEKTCNI